MDKTTILNELQNDEEIGNGEILGKNRYGVLYLNYEDDTEVFYRYGEYCTKNVLKSKIILGDMARKIGLTKTMIANLIYNAYGDELKDAMCTLNYIGIFLGRNDFTSVLHTINDKLYTGEDLTEFYEYDDFDGYLGKMFHAHQSPMINLASIIESSKEIALDDEMYSYDTYKDSFITNLNRGIGQTILHELRHCMMDTNAFLPEDKYPIEEADEDMVEEYGNRAYDLVNPKYRITTHYVAPKDFKTDFDDEDISIQIA